MPQHLASLGDRKLPLVAHSDHRVDSCSCDSDRRVTLPAPARVGGDRASAVSALRSQVELAPTRAEVGPTRAGVVETSDSVPSAAVSISGEAENTPAGSVLSAAASSLSNLFTKQ